MKLFKNSIKFSRQLSSYSDQFSEHISHITEIENDFLTELQRIEADEQHLSIGIMGQVKAGKSSFLNALLFDGKPILPEAATPKTANLTRIAYGEHPHLTVHYYSPQEWQEIEDDAKGSSDSPRARVAKDLVAMVQHHGVDAATLLAGGQEEVFAVGSVDELMGKLNDYVGENGCFTALVKSTEILLPLPELQGFEIIDTPGMNDPVPSRTQKTRDYMARCDVVFFLSRCSQFLDQSDMDLLAEQLPAKGVKRMVLVAGQLDGAIIDDGAARASLAETEKNVRTRLARRAENEIEKLAIAREKLGDPKIAELLRNLKTPVFTSTFAHGFAHWDQSRWGKSMRHTHEQLAELAESAWSGYQFTPKDWDRLGNFKALTAAYEQARQDKLPLMQARRDDLLPRTQANLQKALSALMAAAEQRIHTLKTGSIQSIEANAKACEGKMAGIAHRLGSTINTAIEHARKTATEARADLRKEMASAARLQTRTGTKKETSSYTITEARKLTNLWGLLGRESETIEETTYVTYEYVAAADAIERLVNYTHESAADLERTFNNIVSMSALRTDLKRALIEELNTGSQAFDPAEFRSTLEGTLNQLALPELKLDIGDCSQFISSKFSGQVRSEKKMEALRQTLRESLDLVFEKLITGLNTAVQQLSSDLENARDSLEKKFTAGLQSELAQLKKDFAAQETEIKRYGDLVTICRAGLAEAAVFAHSSTRG